MPEIHDSYFVVARTALVEVKDKGSRFIARAFEITDKQNAEDIVAGLRKKEYDATHHCYAYICGVEEPARRGFRFDDDGEPSGSAGKPMYDQIAGRKLTNTLIVVARWFGGVKLGVGGLVRAYSECASLALDQAGVAIRRIYWSGVVLVEMSQYQSLVALVSRCEGVMDESAFSDRAQITLRLPLSQVERFRREFADLTSGRGVLRDAKGERS